MEYVSAKDLYELSLGSIVSDIDIDVVIELYQPIIGFKALATYLTLVKDASRVEEDSSFIHETLFNRMQIAPGEFLSSKNVLEAVGLLKTYLKEENGIRTFSYVIYSPKSPKSFFDDVLLKGLLVKYIGEKETTRLASRFKLVLLDINNATDVTSSFTDVFKLDYDDNAFLTQLGIELGGRSVGKYQTNFDFNSFYELLEKNYQILKTAITKKQNKEIERIAALYNLNEETMASIVAESYDVNKAKEDRINFHNVSNLAQKQQKFSFTKKPSGKKSEVTGDSDLANKVKLMEMASPYDFLRIKQNNTKPASADMNIIDDISRDYSLNNGVINALVDYALVKNDNKLMRAYIEKLAAQLARANIETAIDTMNYLNRATMSYQANKTETKEVTQTVNESKESKVETAEDSSWDELDKLFK